MRHHLQDGVTERTDGTGGSVDAVMGAAIGPYRKSPVKLTTDGAGVVSAAACGRWRRSSTNH